MREIFSAAGLEVKSLKRVRIGAYRMPRDLRVGEFRYLKLNVFFFQVIQLELNVPNGPLALQVDLSSTSRKMFPFRLIGSGNSVANLTVKLWCICPIFDLFDPLGVCSRTLSPKDLEQIVNKKLQERV